MKHKLFAGLMALLLCAGLLAGCAGGESSALPTTSVNDASLTAAEAPAEREKLSVVTTIFAPYDFVRAIAGDSVELTMLLPPGSEAHSFEPTPSDILTIQSCDVFIYVGGESESWIDGILASMDTSGIRVLSLLDMVETLEEEIVEGMQVDDDHDDEDEDDGHDEEEVELDEHVWTSPVNAAAIVSQLAATLGELDEANAAAYNETSTAYLAELADLHAAFTEVVENGSRDTIIFGDRFPFRYFAYEYGLQYFAAFPGCSTETEPGIQTVMYLINKVAEEEIPVVFHIEFSNANMANTIAEETGATVLQLHSAHNVTKDELEAGVTYLDIMWDNVEALKEALA